MKALFLKPNAARLKKISQEIPLLEINLGETKEIIQTMLEIAYGQQKDNKKPVMVGLAAPQIGIFKRIILVDIAANGKGKTGNLQVYINPEIVWQSKKEGEWYEGCYSTGKVCGIVSRPASIKIQSFTLQPGRLQAKFVEEKHTDYIARIFQHEIDHLNGKTFITHIKNPNNLHLVEKNEFALYRNKEAWRNWPKKCSFSKWKSINQPPS